MSANPSSNQMTGAEAMVRMLEAHGVRHIFGLCGDTTLPFYDALYRLDHKIEHILTRDERSAAYMADGYARVTGKGRRLRGTIGRRCNIYLPGLVEANESSVPILAITSDVGTRSRGHYPLTELDQEGLMRPLTKFNQVIAHSDAVPDVVRTAFRTMTTGRPGSAHLALPIDVQRGPVDPDDLGRSGARRLSRLSVRPGSGAYRGGSRRDPVGQIPGSHLRRWRCAFGGESAFRTFVDALDIAVATTISGQGTIAETHPNCMGVVGSNGGVPATREVVEMADLVVFIGCRAGSVTTELWRVPPRAPASSTSTATRKSSRILPNRSRCRLGCATCA